MGLIDHCRSNRPSTGLAPVGDDLRRQASTITTLQAEAFPKCQETFVGRDRDPFERTLSGLRRHLVTGAPLQGAPLSVKAFAAQLLVSPTPVREALARLSGEGLVARTQAGYAGVVHDRESLMGLYDLASVLAQAVLTNMAPAEPIHAPAAGFIERLAARAANRALMVALLNVAAQLAPFRRAEGEILQEAQDDPGRGKAGEATAPSVAEVRRYFRRRSRHAGEILARALGL
jgi:DNA-binding transcriptional regulator YhcF (GntR family)